VLLKCLEGESAQSINDLLLFHERALPDLGNNIQCGNSLISTDIYGTKVWKKLSEQERARMRPFNWQEGFNTIMKSGGFDAVIGNPPYIDSEWMTTWLPNDRVYLSEHYQSAKGNWDIFCVFVDKALQLCKTGGLSSMIVPNKLGSANYAAGASGRNRGKFATVDSRLFPRPGISGCRVSDCLRRPKGRAEIRTPRRIRENASRRGIAHR